jgi:hypothetical protein
MHMLLVVAEQLVLLLGKVVRPKGYLKTMRRFWRSFEVCILALVDRADKVKCVSLTLLFPGPI